MEKITIFILLIITVSVISSIAIKTKGLYLQIIKSIDRTEENIKAIEENIKSIMYYTRNIRNKLNGKENNKHKTYRR